MLDEGVGVQPMFRRKKQDSVDGDVCPYCEFVNAEGVESCAQCYYVLDKSARDQPMAAPSLTGGELMATLMGEEEPEEEEVHAVEAVLTLDEVTVDIDQGQLLGDGDDADLGFIKAGSPTLSETVDYQSPEAIELEASDAPQTPVDFVIEAHDPMAEVAEPVHTGLGNLYSPITKNKDNDTDLTGSVGPDPNTVPMTPDLPDLPGESPVMTPALPVAQAVASVPLPVTASATATAVEPLAPAVVETPALPEMSAPSTPDLPDVASQANAAPVEAQAAEPGNETPEGPGDLAPTTPELPEEPDDLAPTTPELPEGSTEVTEPNAPAPEPQHNNRIWPWPAKQPWDPRQVYREVVAVLEAIKAGKLPEAANTLDELGPHLEGNLDMLLHIGAAMRQLGREEHLQWTLSMAQHVHPNDEQVAAAVAQLGTGA